MRDTPEHLLPDWCYAPRVKCASCGDPALKEDAEEHDGEWFHPDCWEFEKRAEQKEEKKC